MRADRLVALVLLLQTHGRCTAGQLAEVLDASPRTIRRDLEALSTAGVPVFSQRGRGGGWALLGGHRIDLSGLTAGEARALVLAATGAPDQEGVEAALRKVLAALPATLRNQVQAARASIHVDRTGWGNNRYLEHDGPQAGGEGCLGPLRRALDAGVQVDLHYGRPDQPASWRRVHPRGLVVKRGVWYLVATAAPGLRIYRLSRVVGVALSTEPVSAPDGFDLRASWEARQRELAARRPRAEVTVELLVEPLTWPRLSAGLGAWWDLVDLGVEVDGRRRVLLSVSTAPRAAAELLAFGDSVEVRAPAEVRAELAALGRRLAERYSTEAR